MVAAVEAPEVDEGTELLGTVSTGLEAVYLVIIKRNYYDLWVTLIYTRIACPTGVLVCAPTAVVQSTREYCSQTQKLNLVSTGSL